MPRPIVCLTFPEEPLPQCYVDALQHNVVNLAPPEHDDEPGSVVAGLLGREEEHDGIVAW